MDQNKLQIGIIGTGAIGGFYGAMLANSFFLPIADKLAMRAEQEAGNKELILESVIGIREGISPRILEQSLAARVEPEDGAQQAPA